MRNYTLCFIFFSLLSISTVFAKETPPIAIKVPSHLKEVVIDQIDYPKFAKNDLIEGVVWMRICVNESSILKIVDLSSTNPELGEYVKSKLTSVHVEKPECKTNQIYYLKVKFDLIEQ